MKTMTTLVISWERIEGGRLFAHFPEPFPMDDAEWTAFAGLFDRLGFLLQDDGDTRAAFSEDASRQLVEGLKALGYEIEQRGDVPTEPS